MVKWLTFNDDKPIISLGLHNPMISYRTCSERIKTNRVLCRNRLCGFAEVLRVYAAFHWKTASFNEFN